MIYAPLLEDPQLHIDVIASGLSRHRRSPVQTSINSTVRHTHMRNISLLINIINWDKCQRQEWEHTTNVLCIALYDGIDVWKLRKKTICHVLSQCRCWRVELSDGLLHVRLGLILAEGVSPGNVKMFFVMELLAHYTALILQKSFLWGLQNWEGNSSDIVPVCSGTECRAWTMLTPKINLPAGD